jgi:hypothetical protein
MSRVVQVLLYAALAAFIGYFSVAPPYRYANPELASVKLSLSHAANRIKDCVRLTPDQINARARRGELLNECERERLPLSVEIEMDGEIVLTLTAAPSGLWNDGPASVYERFDVAAGKHTITARLRDSDRIAGWDYEHTESVELSPGRYFTIRFRAETGGFAFR